MTNNSDSQEQSSMYCRNNKIKFVTRRRVDCGSAGGAAVMASIYQKTIKKLIGRSNISLGTEPSAREFYSCLTSFSETIYSLYDVDMK